MVRIGFIRNTAVARMDWWMRLVFWLGQLKFGQQDYIHVVLEVQGFMYSFSYPDQDVYFLSVTREWYIVS